MRIGILRSIALAVALGSAAPLPSFAQDQTLADIRQQLTQLYVQIQELKRELSTTGLVATNISGSTPLERLNAIEAELQRLTSKTEEIEHRVNRISPCRNNTHHLTNRVIFHTTPPLTPFRLRSRTFK